jgi:hypothetical protein
MKLNQDICVSIIAGQDYICGSLAAAGRLPHRPYTGEAGRCSKGGNLGTNTALGNSRLRRQRCALSQWPSASPRAAQL